MLNPLNLISRFIKSNNQRELDKIQKIVDKINALENKISNLHKGYFLFLIHCSHFADWKCFFLQAFEPNQGINL